MKGSNKKKPVSPAPYDRLNLRSLRHLALHLNLPMRFLEDMARYARLHYNPVQYRAKKIKGTKPREIDAPGKLLKHVQRRINQALLADLCLPDTIHSYRKGRSSKTAALIHQGQRFLWHGDIRDFYPSISHRRVYGTFTSLGCTPDVARLLTQLTTSKHRLPQGTPTRPLLANLYLRVSGIAARLEALARKQRFHVTFFGDDILVSSSQSLRGFESLFNRIVSDGGLTLNPKKTVPTSGPREPHRALGIVLNAGDGVLDVPRSYRRRIRSLLRLCRRYGPSALAACGVTNSDPRAFLAGKINYAVHINERHRDLYEELDKVAW